MGGRELGLFKGGKGGWCSWDRERRRSAAGVRCSWAAGRSQIMQGLGGCAYKFGFILRAVGVAGMFVEDSWMLCFVLEKHFSGFNLESGLEGSKSGIGETN